MRNLYKSLEEMKTEVKKKQSFYGEEEFNWEKSTEEIIATILNSFKEFGSEERFEHIRGQMPLEVKEYLKNQ